MDKLQAVVLVVTDPCACLIGVISVAIMRWKRKQQELYQSFFENFQ